ncbi:MAG: hypothetical protein QNJ97_17320 [Myxococcota bacterium]|nr:hypothetical protein [Myxococcota bacterium]
MTIYCVKGSSIRTKFDYVSEHYGPPAKASMAQHFRERHKTLFPILNVSWYPYDTYVEVLEYISKTYFNNDPSKLEDIGAASAKKALYTTYRSFIISGDYGRFLQKISQLHHMLYNLGKIEVEMHENQRGCDIVQSNKPRYAETDLYVASGFYQETARLHDKRDVKCMFILKENKAHFTVFWK